MAKSITWEIRERGVDWGGEFDFHREYVDGTKAHAIERCKYWTAALHPLERVFVRFYMKPADNKEPIRITQ